MGVRNGPNCAVGEYSDEREKLKSILLSLRTRKSLQEIISQAEDGLVNKDVVIEVIINIYRSLDVDDDFGIDYKILLFKTINDLNISDLDIVTQLNSIIENPQPIMEYSILLELFKSNIERINKIGYETLYTLLKEASFSTPDINTLFELIHFFSLDSEAIPTTLKNKIEGYYEETLQDIENNIDVGSYLYEFSDEDYIDRSRASSKIEDEIIDKFYSYFNDDIESFLQKNGIVIDDYISHIDAGSVIDAFINSFEPEYEHEGSHVSDRDAYINDVDDLFYRD